MASQVTSPTPATSNKYEKYIDDQLEKTRARIKLVDLCAGVFALVGWILGVMLFFSVVDGWIWTLGTFGRVMALTILLLGIGIISVFYIAPLFLRKINPNYAARMIEQARPKFKNSILNYLWTKSVGEDVHRSVAGKLSQQAANDISEVTASESVDQSHLIRSGFIVVGLSILAVGYCILSPKSPLPTLARVANPFSDIARPAIVRVVSVKPGNADVFFGDVLPITAEIRGHHEPHDIQLVYATDDGQHTNVPLAMNATGPRRYEVELRTSGAGIQQDLKYKIVARDGESPWFQVNVRPLPAVMVQRLKLIPPKYTKLPERVITGTGEAEGIEGTRVVIEAIANMPIESAYLEFLGPDPSDSENFRVIKTGDLEFQDQNITGTFLLALKPFFTHYQIRYRSQNGDLNSRPNRYPVRITPDRAPELHILEPRNNEVFLPVNGTLNIKVEAIDVDYEISSVTLQVENKAIRILNHHFALPAGDKNRIRQDYWLVPEKLSLKPGDKATFFAVAADNRHSPYGALDPNTTRSENYTVIITEADPQIDKQKRDEDIKQAQQQQQQENQQDEKSEAQEQQSRNSDEQEQTDPGENQPNDSQKPGDETDPQEGETESGDEEEGSQGGGSGDSPQDSDNPQEQGNEGTGSDPNSQEPQDEQSGNNEENSDASDSDDGNSQEPQGGSSSQNDQENEANSQGNSGNGTSEASNQGLNNSGQSNNGNPGEGTEKNGDAGDNTGGQRSEAEGGGERDNNLQEGAISEDAPAGEVFEELKEYFDNQRKANESGSDQTSNNEQPNDPSNEGSQGSSEPKEGTGEKPANPETPEKNPDGSPNGQSPNSEEPSDTQENTGESGNSEKNTEDQGQPDSQSEGSPSENPDSNGTEKNGPDGQNPQDKGNTQPNSEQEQTGPDSDNPGGQPNSEKQNGNDDSQQPGDNSGDPNQSNEGQGNESQPENSGEQNSNKQGKSGESQSEKSDDSNGESSGQPQQGSPSDSGTSKGSGGDASDSKSKGGASDTQFNPNNNQDAPVQTNDEFEKTQRDKENVQFAKEATDLILSKLREQENDPDAELLERFNWTKEELSEFIKSWEKMRDAAEKGGVKEKRRYESRLKSLGLRSADSEARKLQGQRDQQFGLSEEGAINRPPADWAERYNRFMKNRNKIERE